MPSPPTAIPTNVVTTVDDITVTLDPDLPGVTVLALLKPGPGGAKVPLAAAWLTEPDQHQVARQLDPNTYIRVGELEAANRLLAEELAPARYVHGPPGCVYDTPDDRACEEYEDLNGCDRLDVEYCSHVQARTATFADVRARGRLEDILLGIRDLAARPDTAVPADLAEDIDDALSALRDELADLGGRAAWSAADCRAAAAELDEATARWNDREGAERAREDAETLYDLRKENERLRAANQQLVADLAAAEAAPRLRLSRPCVRCGCRNLPAGQALCDPPCHPPITTRREAS